MKTAEDWKRERESGTHPVERTRAHLNANEPEIQEIAATAPEYFEDLLKVRNLPDVAKEIEALTPYESLVFLVSYSQGIKQLRDENPSHHKSFMMMLMASLIAYFTADAAALVMAAATRFALDWVESEEGEEAAASLLNLVKFNSILMMDDIHESDPEAYKRAQEHLKERWSKE